MINKFTGEKQTRFEKFVDRITDGNELVLLEEIFQKDYDGISGKEMEQTFYEQCLVFFNMEESINELLNNRTINTERTGVLQ